MYHALDFNNSISRQVQKEFTTSLLHHHLLIVGQTGSGKTTTTLALLSYMQQLNQTTIVLDPTGEYSKLPNTITYRLGDNSYLEAGKLNAQQLLMAVQAPAQITAKLRQAISDLQIQHNVLQRSGVYKRLNRPVAQHRQLLHQLDRWASDYPVQNLFSQLIEEYVVPFENDKADYTKLGQQYDRPHINQSWDALTSFQDQLASPAFQQLFDTRHHPGEMKTELNFVLTMFLSHPSVHRTLVVDLSILKDYESSQRLVISLLLKAILKEQLKKGHPFPVNIVIDEAHRYLPRDSHNLADNGIFQVLREGRKARLRMILTTQSPLDLPARLRSQFSGLLIHRLTSQAELASISGQLTLAETQTLPVGQAFLQLIAHKPELVRINLPSWWKAS